MKFGQFIEDNMRREIFSKCAGETIPRPISNKSKLSLFLNQ